MGNCDDVNSSRHYSLAIVQCKCNSDVLYHMVNSFVPQKLTMNAIDHISKHFHYIGQDPNWTTRGLTIYPMIIHPVCIVLHLRQKQRYMLIRPTTTTKDSRGMKEGKRWWVAWRPAI